MLEPELREPRVSSNILVKQFAAPCLFIPNSIRICNLKFARCRLHHPGSRVPHFISAQLLASSEPGFFEPPGLGFFVKYDIFSGSIDNAPLWLETVDDLEEARERMKQRGLESPGPYFAYCSFTQTVVEVINTSDLNDSAALERQRESIRRS